MIQKPTLKIQLCGWQHWLKPSGRCCFPVARPLLDSCSCIRFRCCGAAEPPNLLPSLDSLNATLEIQQIEGLWLAALAGAVLLWRGPGSGSCFLRSIAVLVYNSEGHVRPPGLWLATLAGRCCFAVARPWSGSGFLRSTALVSFCLISFRRPR